MKYYQIKFYIIILQHPLLSFLFYYLPGPNIEDGCFTGSDCSGDTVPLTSTGFASQFRECCLSDNGQSYNAFDQCNVCVGKCCSIKCLLFNGMLPSFGCVAFSLQNG